jgi:LmbE family N-acetylglucosaminyl deacetylase
MPNISLNSIKITSQKGKMNLSDLIPKPDILTCKRLLCIQPHQDDMDISAGGTIARLVANGTEVIYLTVTDGSAGFSSAEMPEAHQRSDIRKAEQQKAGKILGVKEYHWLDFPDAGDWSLYDARNAIVEVIREVKPDFVLTFDPWLAYEAHQDHIKCGLAASEALILFKLPFIKTDNPVDKDIEAHEIEGVAFCTTAKPNTVIDVGPYREDKFKAIAEHKSQFNSEFLDLLKTYDEFRGKNLADGHEFEFGEGFKILNPTYMLHDMPESVDY